MSVRIGNPMSALVWAAFFVPAAVFGVWGDRCLGIAALILGCAVLIAKPSPWEARRPAMQALAIFVLLEILYVISFLYSAAFNGIQIGPRDYFELTRYVVLGAFVVHLIRHYDGSVRGNMEWAMAAELYPALLSRSWDARGYVAVLTLCYLLFFSRLRLRFLHAAAALLVVFLSGDLTSWAAALFVLSAALAVRLYRALVRRRLKRALGASLVFYVLLLGSAALSVHITADADAAAAASTPARDLQLARRSLVFGLGPAEYEGLSPKDDQYLRWFLKGGAPATGLILVGLSVVGYRLLLASWGDLKRFVGAATFLASVVALLAAGPYLESFRLFFLTSFFIAGMNEAGR